MSAPGPGYASHVSGLAAATTEENLHDFFSLCGKLVSVKKDGSQADVTFEKLSAMQTSVMLNGGTLDGAHLEVTSTSDTEPQSASVLPTGATGSSPIGPINEITQEDKPKAAIIAKYLAHGYVMGDHVIQRALDFDREWNIAHLPAASYKQGISSRFLNFLDSVDKSVGQRVVGENKTVSGKLNEQAQLLAVKTKEVDQKRGVSAKFHDYYSKAIARPIGQNVVQFYTTTQKQVQDVHEEARRIADEKKAASSTLS